MVANLKALRTKFNLSQQQLADIIGVSQQSINKYENHHTEPDIETLKALANYFNTSIDYLVGYTNDEEITDNKSELLGIFSLMTPEQQRIYIEQGKVFVKSNNEFAKGKNCE